MTRTQMSRPVMVTRGRRGRMEADSSAAYLSAAPLLPRLMDAAPPVRGRIPRMLDIPEDVARACVRAQTPAGIRAGVCDAPLRDLTLSPVDR